MAVRRAAPAPIVLSPSPTGSTPLLGTKRRILILDDNWFFAASLRLALDDEESLGVCDASPRPEGLEERLAHFRPHLLIFDLSIGSVSGLSVAKHLRGRGWTTPIVFLSSQQALADDELAAIGNCAFLPKDKRPATLIRLVKRLLAEADAARLASSSASFAVAPGTTADGATARGPDGLPV
jgi:DNA-binding NarL/FixJ family response regulator